jgi:hypothetical protein
VYFYFSFWYYFATSEYGNCHAFNSKYNTLDEYNNRIVTLTGVSNGIVSKLVFKYNIFLNLKNIAFIFLGLSVEIFLDQANYMVKKLSKSAGARIVIHDPLSPPLPDEYGLDLRPNTASSIAIQKVLFYSRVQNYT